MVLHRRRFATWLLLAGYLFAVTAANSFHDHGRREGAGHGSASSHALRAHPEHGMGLRPSGPIDGRPELARSGGPLVECSDDGCPVCQFLLLKLLPMRPVESIHVEALREKAVAARPLAAARPPLLCHRGRGPPPVA
jgi:hypothetical protein